MAAKKQRFLVVDDDADSRATIVEFLEAMGHSDVLQAQDGAEALRLVQSGEAVDFIISDWEMPQLTGIQLLQSLRSLPQTAHVPFLMVTSPVSQELEKVVLAAESLVDAYLIKPFPLEQLRTKIDKMRGAAQDVDTQKIAVVVDDDPDARDMTREYLQQFGFKTVEAFANGKDTLAFLRRMHAHIGLIVSDWEMPDINGIELLRACRTHPDYQAIPFLMVTSQTSMENMKVMQAAKSAVDQYLLKPFSGDDFKMRVGQVLEKSRSRSKIEKLVQTASQHLQYRRWEEAKEVFDEILRVDPVNDFALREMGDLILKAQGVDAAIPIYKQAVDFSPLNAANYLKLMNAYELHGWTDRAIQLLRQAVANISFHADLHFHLGRLYFRKGQVDAARTELEKALELQIHHQEARLMLEMLPKKK